MRFGFHVPTSFVPARTSLSVSYVLISIEPWSAISHHVAPIGDGGGSGSGARLHPGQLLGQIFEDQVLGLEVLLDLYRLVENGIGVFVGGL